jgi:hypothetical protein
MKLRANRANRAKCGDVGGLGAEFGAEPECTKPKGTRMADQPDIRTILRGMVGYTHPGGCDTCTATQTLAEVHPGVFVNTISHDDDCPVLAHHRQTRTDQGS